MFVKQKVVAIMTLGEIIKNYRAEHKMSMDAFSQKVGLSKAYISILERHFNPSSRRAPEPTLDAIAAVSVAIGMDVNELIAKLDRKQKIKLPTVTDEELLDDELISRLCQLTPEEMEKVDAFVQGLLAAR